MHNKSAEMLHNIALFPEENPYPVLRADRKGVLLYANRAAEDLLTQWQCAVGGVVPGFVIHELTAALNSCETRELETRCGEREFSFSLVPIGARDYVNFYGRDVTNRKRLDAALIKSKERLKRAQEIAHLGSWELEFDTNSLTWSDEVYRIFGLEPQEFVASYDAFLAAVHPDDRAAVDDAYSSSLHMGRDSYEIEHRIIRKTTGEVRFVHEKCEHVRDETGRIIRSVGMVQDITERRRREQVIERLNADLKAQTEKLADANQELEAFNYTVAHDLRKPLTVIRGYSEILAGLCEHRDEKSFTYLQEIQDGIRRMSRLIDSLLEFSSLSHAAISTGKVDLALLARMTIAELQALEPERRVSLLIDEVLVVEGDVDLLQLVMNNLIGNAWKYTANCEDAVIGIGTVRMDGETVWFVRDTGIGFEPADADQLFVPFKRLGGSEEVSGFGIGLATVERAIRRHGGRIWGEGNPGQGAAFYFTLG